jgi:peptide methionine sulfoxide reductase msrA/msrB
VGQKQRAYRRLGPKKDGEAGRADASWGMDSRPQQSKRRALPVALAVCVALAAVLFEVAARQESPPSPMDPRSPSQGKPAVADLKAQLTPEQFRITQQAGTEPPFDNAYWNNHADGIYIDVVSREPLFSSLDKYDSGTGWPSFSRPLSDRLVLKTDRSLGGSRTEVRSGSADSHLGHVFDDGPGPTGQRFCMNSAALKFVPLAELQAAGLGEYLFRFADKQHWEIATLAGGCFWGMEEFFRKHPGVITTQVGYSGGTFDKPGYGDITTGRTGHAESIQVLFDPKKLTYEDLLVYFFKIHDPTTLDQQGNDRGSQYRSAIFVGSAAQRTVAEKVKQRVNKSGQWKRPVVTQISPLGQFWRAEPEHQDYLERHPGGYSCHFERKLSF